MEDSVVVLAFSGDTDPWDKGRDQLYCAYSEMLLGIKIGL